MKKRSKSKSLNGWNSIYELAALLDMESLLSDVGRKKKSFSAEPVKSVHSRFDIVRKAELSSLKLQAASYIVPIVSELYEHLRKGSLQPDEILKTFYEVVYLDQADIGRLIKRCEIPEKSWSLLSLDSKEIVTLRGAKEAAAIQVGKIMGVSVRTVQRKSKPASDTVSFVVRNAPLSKKDNSKYEQRLAIEILCNTFHLDRKRVTEQIEELFAL